MFKTRFFLAVLMVSVPKAVKTVEDSGGNHDDHKRNQKVTDHRLFSS